MLAGPQHTAASIDARPQLGRLELWMAKDPLVSGKLCRWWNRAGEREGGSEQGRARTGVERRGDHPWALARVLHAES